MSGLWCVCVGVCVVCVCVGVSVCVCVSAFQERETVSVEAPMEIDVDKDLEVIVAGVTSVNLAHGDEEVAQKETLGAHPLEVGVLVEENEPDSGRRLLL